MQETRGLTEQTQVEATAVPLNQWLNRDPEEIRLNAKAVLQRHADQQAQATKERQAGRLKGELTHSLHEKLEACTPQQLEEVIRIARRFQQRYKKPPLPQECQLTQTVQVLKAVPVREELYTLEFRRSSKRASRVSVNGPYVIRHWRDGNFVKHQHIRKKLLNVLPKKVKAAFNPILANPATEELRQRLSLDWANRTGPD